MLSKDLEAMQPHVRRFVERAVTFTTCPDCDGTRLTKQALSSRINGKNIADLCRMQISDLAIWLRDVREPSVAPLLTGLQHHRRQGRHDVREPSVAPLLTGLQHLL